MHPVCTHYDCEIDDFNITDDVATNTPAPMEVMTFTPSVATTISTQTTPISTDVDTSVTTTPNPIPTLPDTGVYLNNSTISLEDIGEGEDALICRTNNRSCCATPPNRAGEFYDPKGDLVPIRSRAKNFYRNRGEGEIRLNRITGSTVIISGRFTGA